MLLRNFAKFTGKHLCQSLFFTKVTDWGNFVKKETLAQVPSCGFFKISKNTFSYGTSLVAASVSPSKVLLQKLLIPFSQKYNSIFHLKKTLWSNRFCMISIPYLPTWCLCTDFPLTCINTSCLIHDGTTGILYHFCNWTTRKKWPLLIYLCVNARRVSYNKL